MTIKLFNTRALATVAALALLTLAATGCNKDNIKPDTPGTPEEPAEPDYFVYGEDTLAITGVTRFYDADNGYHKTTIELEQGFKFVVESMKVPEGDFNFLRVMQYYTTPDSVYGYLKLTSYDNYIHFGTFSANYVFDRAVIDIEAEAEGYKRVAAHYAGKVQDITTPMGAGNFEFGGTYRNLNMAYGVKSHGMFQFHLTSTEMQFRADVLSLKDLVNRSTVTISDSEQAINDGSAIGLTLDYMAPDGSNTKTRATSGSLYYVVNPNSTVSITASGETPEGPFTLSYNGDFTTVHLAQ